jgi:predicted RNase H-like nuclease (RuvC/YqgF family)
MKMTKEQMEAEIATLRAAIESLENEKKELTKTNTTLYQYCRKMDRQFSQSVKRELSYREMLFVFNHVQAEDLLKEYITKQGLKIQYTSDYNYRAN